MERLIMNEPAFPTPTHNLQNDGMTLRDYFAAKAMLGILFEGLNEAETAENAYAIADAMLSARSTEKAREA
jgi:hypothetical protein